MGKWVIPALLVGDIILHIVLFGHDKRACDAMIEGWAEENDYELLGLERRAFHTGPFRWHSGRGVYRIAIKDHEGNIRGGWVRCGQLLRWSGMKIDARWDDRQV